MLAEIYMLQLEARARVAKEAEAVTRNIPIALPPVVPIALPPVKAS
jgi:hypothetical protein